MTDSRVPEQYQACAKDLQLLAGSLIDLTGRLQGLVYESLATSDPVAALMARVKSSGFDLDELYRAGTTISPAFTVAATVSGNLASQDEIAAGRRLANRTIGLSIRTADDVRNLNPWLDLCATTGALARQVAARFEAARDALLQGRAEALQPIDVLSTALGDFISLSREQSQSTLEVIDEWARTGLTSPVEQHLRQLTAAMNLLRHRRDVANVSLTAVTLDLLQVDSGHRHTTSRALIRLTEALENVPLIVVGVMQGARTGNWNQPGYSVARSHRVKPVHDALGRPGEQSAPGSVEAMLTELEHFKDQVLPERRGAVAEGEVPGTIAVREFAAPAAVGFAADGR